MKVSAFALLCVLLVVTFGESAYATAKPMASPKAKATASPMPGKKIKKKKKIVVKPTVVKAIAPSHP
jgi:hypothetical protein